MMETTVSNSDGPGEGDPGPSNHSIMYCWFNYLSVPSLLSVWPKPQQA